MTSPLERAQHLLALAVHGPEDGERRNAAVELVRLIDRHGFLIVAASPPASPPTADPAPVVPTAWLALFRVADPLLGKPQALCEALQWSQGDLLAVGRDRKVLSNVKLRRLRDFCGRHGLALPLDAAHPALARILALPPEKAKAVTVARHDAPRSLEDVARRVADEVTLSNVVDFLRR